jgi:hypothetical protein
MTEIRITLPEKTADSDVVNDSLLLELNRCGLPRCQVAIVPGRDFCCSLHRYEYRNKFPHVPRLRAERVAQASLHFHN